MPPPPKAQPFGWFVCGATDGGRNPPCRGLVDCTNCMDEVNVSSLEPEKQQMAADARVAHTNGTGKQYADGQRLKKTGKGPASAPALSAATTSTPPSGSTSLCSNTR